MSQFGFFNTPQPQPQPAARPVYDAFPGKTSIYQIIAFVLASITFLFQHRIPHSRLRLVAMKTPTREVSVKLGIRRYWLPPFPAPSPRRDDRGSFYGAPVSAGRGRTLSVYMFFTSFTVAPSPRRDDRASFFGAPASSARGSFSLFFSTKPNSFFDPIF